jgi:hypothetical protein
MSPGFSVKHKTNIFLNRRHKLDLHFTESRDVHYIGLYSAYNSSTFCYKNIAGQTHYTAEDWIQVSRKSVHSNYFLLLNWPPGIEVITYFSPYSDIKGET